MKKVLALLLAFALIVGCTSAMAEAVKMDKLTLQFVPSKDADVIITGTKNLPELLKAEMLTQGYDIGEIDIDPKKPAVRIRYKSRIADLERARERRMTHEDQQIEFPGDMFYQYTGTLSDVVINWGNNGSG